MTPEEGLAQFTIEKTLYHLYHPWASGVSVGKESACSAGDLGLIPVLGRSPGEGHGNPLQFLPGESPWTEEPGGLQSMGSQIWTRLSD